MSDKLWLTTEEVAEIEGVSSDAILKRIRRKKYSSALIKKVARDIGGYEYILHISLFLSEKMQVKLFKQIEDINATMNEIFEKAKEVKKLNIKLQSQLEILTK
jgi:hypothetical protein